MKVETLTLDALLYNHAPLLGNEIRQNLEAPPDGNPDFYIRHVRKSPWPEAKGSITATPIYLRNIDEDAETARKQLEDSNDSDGVSVHTFALKKAAVNSPDVCLDDPKTQYEVLQMLKDNSRVLIENAKWIWWNAFQDEVVRHCDTKLVVRKITKELIEQILKTAKNNGNRDILTLVRSYGSRVHRLTQEGPLPIEIDFVQFPQRVNFWGKRVYPYQSRGNGIRWFVNKKYNRAAEKMVVFHPDIVEFFFPKVEQWAGEVMWRNIPSADYNPNGNIGFFRVLFGYAVKPERPEFGTVITVLPPGIRGWVWYLGWKLMGKM